MSLVYVLNKDGLPLMPTHKLGKVRHLLKEGRAKIIKRNPFTIKLNYECNNYTQDVTLGVDAGSKHIGLSASTQKKELYCSDVELRNDIVDLLSIDLIGVVPDDENIITQTNKGEPVIKNKKAPSGKAYIEIAKRILGENIDITIPGRERGFFAKIKSLLKKN